MPGEYGYSGGLDWRIWIGKPQSKSAGLKDRRPIEHDKVNAVDPGARLYAYVGYSSPMRLTDSGYFPTAYSDY